MAISEFSRHQHVFTEEDINLVSIAKNMKIYSNVWEKWAKMGISEFCRHKHFVFPEKDHKYRFDIKNYEMFSGQTAQNARFAYFSQTLL